MSDITIRAVRPDDRERLVKAFGGLDRGEREIIVGLGEYARSGAAADIAFAVEEDFQGRGVASRLLERLVEIARANGILRFEADVLAENAPMLAVLRNSGLRMRTSHGQGVVHATLFLAQRRQDAPAARGQD